MKTKIEGNFLCVNPREGNIRMINLRHVETLEIGHKATVFHMLSGKTNTVSNDVLLNVKDTLTFHLKLINKN